MSIVATLWASRRIAAVSIAGVLPACFSIGPDHAEPPAEIRSNWSEALEASMQAAPEPAPLWWRTFDDPVLQSLVEEAFAQNLSLENAALRVLQARVVRRVNYQALAPLPLLGAGVTHLNLSQNVKPDVEVDVPDPPGPKTIKLPGGPLHPEGRTITIDPDITIPVVSVSDSIDIYDVGLDALWELDIWGKRRRGICAASAEVDAANAAYADAYVSLAGEVAATYVQIRTLEDRQRALQSDLAMLRRASEVSQQRLDAGQVSELDVLQTTALIAESEAELPALRASERAARTALCVLVGRPPGHVDERLAAASAIPSAPAQIAIGIPADLLRRRADVRQAERTAAAECERIGMKKSELYPQFSLIGSIGWASSHSSDLFDGESGRGAYGVGAKWNILLYTLIMDAVRIQDANYQQAIFGYQETVLRAAKEVEDAGTALVNGHERLAKLEAARVSQEKAASLSADLYEKGEVDLARLLDAQRSMLRIHDEASQARGAIALSAIALYKALGGGWESLDANHLIDESTWKQLDERADWDWYRPEAGETPVTPVEGGAP